MNAARSPRERASLNAAGLGFLGCVLVLALAGLARLLQWWLS